MFKEISPHTLNKWMSAPDTILIDVREPSEFDHERIKGAVHVPLSTVSFDLLPLKGKFRIVFQCRSGKRSQLACERIFDDISDEIELYSLEGGILAWKEANFPILSGAVKSDKKAKQSCMSGIKCPMSFRSCLHRLCFMAGLSIFAIIALCATISPNFACGFVFLAITLMVAAFKLK
jgi:rhodanese-related sulfurtransferase